MVEMQCLSLRNIWPAQDYRFFILKLRVRITTFSGIKCDLQLGIVLSSSLLHS